MNWADKRNGHHISYVLAKNFDEALDLIKKLERYDVRLEFRQIYQCFTVDLNETKVLAI